MNGANEILEQLVLKATTRDSEETVGANILEEIGGLVRDFRSALALSPTQFAARLQKSVQAVHQWEKGNIPLNRIHSFRQLVQTKAAEVTKPAIAQPAVEVASSRYKDLGIYFPREVREKEALAKEAWNIQLGEVPFSEQYISVVYADILRKGKGVHNFVFNGLNNTAHRSYASLRRALSEYDADVLGQMHAWSIDEKEMNSLGISILWPKAKLLLYPRNRPKGIDNGYDVLFGQDLFTRDEVQSEQYLQLHPRRFPVEEWLEFLKTLKSRPEVSDQM